MRETSKLHEAGSARRGRAKEAPRGDDWPTSVRPGKGGGTEGSAPETWLSEGRRGRVELTRRRYGATIAVSVTALVLGSSCGVIAGEPEPETVVIGVDLPLSGDGERLGQTFHQAIELRVEQVNAQGLLGDRQLELRVEDNRSNEERSTENLESFAADASVTAIITGGCDSCVVAVAEQLNEQGAPTISLGRANDVATPADDRTHIFKLGPNAADNASVLVRELVAVGAETVAIVTGEDTYSQDGLAEMTNAADRNDIETVVTGTIGPDTASSQELAAEVTAYEPPDESPGAGDFPPPNSPEVAEEQVGPDSVVIWAPPPMVGEFALALREEGYQGPLFLDSSAADAVLVGGEVGVALAGARMVFTEMLVIDDVIATSPARAARKNWFRDYTARYGAYDAASSFGADAVELLVHAINNASPGTDREAVRGGIVAAQLEGFTGTISLNPRQHSGLAAQSLTTLVVRGERWRLG